VADTEVVPNVPVVDGPLGAPAFETAACQAKICGGIRYDVATLNEIHRIALDRFLSIPRGGLEVGGLLFGKLQTDEVEILAAENFPIEYLSGPSFVLSERDEVSLSERLSGTTPEAGGEPLEIIGWWHSHTRTDVDLTPEDIRVHRKFFPQPTRVALIIKPFKFDPSQVAVYRLGDEHANVACSTFSVGKGALRKPAAPALAQAPAPVESPVVSVPLETAPVSMASPPAHVIRGGARRRLIAVSAMVLLITSGVLAWRYSLPPPQQTSAVPVAPIQLSVSGAGSELTIRWDDTSNLLSSAQSAELIIVDGPEATRVPLGVDSLRSATLSYARRTSKVEVRLRARSRTNELIEAAAHYVGPAPVESRPPDPDVERMKAELDRVNGELMRMRSVESPKPIVVTATVADPPSPKIRSFVPKSLPKPAAIPSASTAQPAYVPPPAITTASSGATPPQIPVQTPTISVPAPVAPKPAAPAPVIVKPSSGRAIWTGLLPPGGLLLFDGRRPSSGAITGRLPQRPSRVHVYPADLTEAGIVIYTDGSKQKVEPPGPANGWNLTTYRADGKRSRDVTVVEPPAQSNNWQRLMVRSEQRRVSMLVVEWEELP
jgi:proteasome lid subunit RPN8/RPN11